ncbi:MAG TPA: sugar phosphate isomerase/epimerase family protein [Bauldia sp.]|nr:sugar phosphate isomerase/epimerase family protein [Bauldia sp.]
MKIGFDLLLWTTGITDAHWPIIEDLKATGYDGIEVPVFAGKPDDYVKIARRLDDMGLDRTAVSVIPTPDLNPLSADPADRKRAVEYLNWVSDCTAAVGASIVCGPLHQTLGHFSGSAPTDEERARAAEVHGKVGDYAQKQGVRLALEAVNRFECYFANTMDDLCAYTRKLGHPSIKAMYDTFHANIEEKDPVAAFVRNKDEVIHIHITENDRGVPGRGHVPWAETYRAIRRSGYDAWLTIEAFGRGLPELAAATRVWRDFSEGPHAVYRDGYKAIREGWDNA